MLSIICQTCEKEFKISGADFAEHRSDGSLALCPACAENKKQEKLVEIIPTKSKGRKEENGK